MKDEEEQSEGRKAGEMLNNWRLKNKSNDYLTGEGDATTGKNKTRFAFLDRSSIERFSFSPTKLIFYKISLEYSSLPKSRTQSIRYSTKQQLHFHRRGAPLSPHSLSFIHPPLFFFLSISLLAQMPVTSNANHQRYSLFFISFPFSLLFFLFLLFHILF